MQKITTTANLKDAIQQLEYKQAAEWPLLKEQLLATYESLKLINIIKATFKEAILTPDLRTDIVNTAIGLTTGIVAKKVIIGKTINPIKKLLGTIVEIAVANKVAKNAGEIKSIGNVILGKIFKQHSNSPKA
jgi:hypothetical protein